MVSTHLLDALAIIPHLPGKNFLDVGSGAGLPGVPVAVARPNCSVTLLDSNQKKAAFLQHAVTELELRNATVRATRVEAWHPDERFDVIASRAFSYSGFISSTAREASSAVSNSLTSSESRGICSLNVASLQR